MLARIDAVIREVTSTRSELGADISLPARARAEAAEAITLLVTDHPTNRARLGKAPGVLSSLVELVDDAWRTAVAHDIDVAMEQSKDSFLAAEAAAEAIWILAYNSTVNHAALIELNAVEVLSSVVTARDALGLQTPSRAVMWAAAALQNIAASYCGGRCEWVWQRGEANRLQPLHQVTLDAEPARRRMAMQPDLVNALVQYACEGPVGPADGGGAPWPSKANVESRYASSIVPWAAAGALKNLAISSVASDGLLTTQNAPRCLCALAHSRDWLEASKAKAALYFLEPRAADRSDGGFSCAVRPSFEPKSIPNSIRDDARAHDEL